MRHCRLRLSIYRSGTLFVLAVLGALALYYRHGKGMRVYPIAALICTAAAVVMGIWMQRDVVEINLVGASNNPCVVCVQNGQAVVLSAAAQPERR